jgi:hypothetical protein
MISVVVLKGVMVVSNEMEPMSSIIPAAQMRISGVFP